MSEFKLFELQHILSLLVTLLLALSNLKIRHVNNSKQKKLALILAWFLLSFYPIYQFYYLFVVKSWQIQTHLQLHISNFIILFLALSLLIKNRILFVLAFFWALSGGIASVLFPDLGDGFPSINFLFFWVSHCILLFLVFFIQNYRSEFKINYKDIWIAFVGMLVYTIIMLPINQMLQSNYGYLIEKPPALNFLNDYGFTDSPNYLLPLLLLILLIFHVVFFVFVYLPRKYFQLRNK